MGQRKAVFTTGEVARICNVAPRTVSKWFDSGQLRGYRIPGSKDRRIPVEHLVRFMQAHGIPLNGLDTGMAQVLVFDGDESFAQALSRSLEAAGSYEVTVASTALSAGAAAQECHPHVLIVDIRTAGVPPQQVARFVRALGGAHAVCLIGIGAGLTEGEGEGLRQVGFDGYLRKPFDARALIECIERTVGGPVLQHAG